MGGGYRIGGTGEVRAGREAERVWKGGGRGEKYEDP